MKNFWSFIMAATFLAMMAMQGCAKLPSPTATSVEQGGVQGAAVFLGTQYPNTVPVILNISNYVITAANGGQIVAVAQVNAQILREEAALPKLTAAEKAGINTFLVALQPLIAQELASNHLSLDSNITIELCWVAQWASNILGGPGTCKIQPAIASAPTAT